MAKKKKEDVKTWNGLELLEMDILNIDFDGIQALSIVEYPAIERNFVRMSANCKDKCHILSLAKADEEKRIITGIALIPDKPILRVDEERKFYINFGKEVVKNIAYDYMKKRAVTIEHQVNANSIELIESWIVEDESNDKSNLYKLSAPVGSWVTPFKVNNESIWHDIKEFGLNGFSIEGFFSQKIGMKGLTEEQEILKEIEELEILINQKQ